MSWPLASQKSTKEEVESALANLKQSPYPRKVRFVLNNRLKEGQIFGAKHRRPGEPIGTLYWYCHEYNSDAIHEIPEHAVEFVKRVPH